MTKERPESTVNRIAEATACTPRQVRETVRLALEALHKVAFYELGNVTTAATECRWAFGGEACFHLVGILEQARIWKDSDLPWSEFSARFLHDIRAEVAPIMDEWGRDKSDERKAIDDAERG